jgi:hypothetical protein
MWQTFPSDSVSLDNPFRREGLIRRTSLLTVPLALGFLLFPFDGNSDEPAFWTGLVLATLFLVSLWVVPWERLPRFWTIVPVLLYIAALALLRHSAGGGLSGYSPLLLMPAIWAALFCERAQVIIVLVAIGLAVVLPPIFTDDEIGGEWRRAFLTVLAAGTAAFAIGSLVSALRREMAERDSLEQRFRKSKALQLNDAVVQDLAVAKYSLDSDNPEQASAALTRALEGSKEIVADMIPKDEPVRPGDLAGPRPNAP